MHREIDAQGSYFEENHVIKEVMAGQVTHERKILKKNLKLVCR